ncbi:hypothetical protein IWQ60_002068 [Tieghemiomyces parasiticus]|uniref:UFSP1/2/DUB catalytic domain-containing protein n=1 Tax=Tieghemiomyces parasiticus TaxID=78921 RepID=A0A9W8AJL3_9FUNG|nr:hypothetical protein IWQ60_002068 [Tieghemiomyces parasiticus]
MTPPNTIDLTLDASKGADPVDVAICPVCELRFAATDVPAARQDHVNAHFDSDPLPPPRPALPGTAAPVSALFDALSIHAATTSPPRPYLARLCAATTRTYSGTRADMTWSCGYRNTQSLLSTSGTIPPAVRELQALIEAAWAQGHDPIGARQLNYRLVGTSTWIGPTEVYGALQVLGARPHLIDFHRPTGPGRTHPDLSRVVELYFLGLLTNLPADGRSLSPLLAARQPQVRERMEDGPPVQITSLPPLYLQHAGHSRAVLGYERAGTGPVNLLVYDPIRPVEFYSRQTPAELLAAVRVHPRSLSAFDQYQLVMVGSEANDTHSLRLCQIP